MVQLASLEPRACLRERKVSASLNGLFCSSTEAALAEPCPAISTHVSTLPRLAQARWAAAKEFEANAPADGDKAAHPKYMATFPYPYMNGRLHLGHAFTVTKADFAAGYQRLRGKNVLFPFAFHCTGMPIQAAANKLSRELDTGSYLKMREAAAAAAAEAASAAAAEEAAPAAAPADEPAAAAASAAPAVPAFKDPNAKFGGKKTKAVAKAGGPGLSQYDILLKSGIPESEIPAFRDPKHWLAYFPPLGKRDLASFGCHVDWRRSFVTTDANPFYDSFIRWQVRGVRCVGQVRGLREARRRSAGCTRP
jgi:leucyl-tRNA synthetase